MVLAFALVFGIVFFAGRLTARAIGRRTRQSALGAFDRVLGVGFGALKGLVMASVLFLGVSLVFDTLYGGRSQRPEWMAKSYTYPLLDATSRALVDIVQQRQASGAETSAS
jgi:membrane protein required for colicin V production